MGGRTLYDESVRRRAATLFDEGLSYRRAAVLLGVPGETVRQWLDTYRSVGLEGLMVMGSKSAGYSFETKLAAVRAVVDEGMTKADAMAKFGIASMSPLKNWMKAYRKGGSEALEPKPKGRPKGTSPKPKALTREQELEQRIRKLEAENAYLKKSIALKAENRSRTAKKPRP